MVVGGKAWFSGNKFRERVLPRYVDDISLPMMLIALNAGLALILIAVTMNLLFAFSTAAIGIYQYCSTWDRAKPGNAILGKKRKFSPFVSVHVATHDEPPALVLATLNALARLDYDAFEVIVIDNNTVDCAKWLPVADHVATMGKRFRFIHADGVRGAKAGALNIALDAADIRAKYVAIVDADYQVSPDFLTLATDACSDDIDYVQFPQSYRQSDGAEAVCSELRDYFTIFPSAANLTGASLLTGTLSLISADALRRVGRWPTGSITEDAELGSILWSAGARGRYVDITVGHGLLPVDLAGLRQQRRRWAAGNMQTLLRVLGRKQDLLRPGAMAIVAQLTAWTGFLAIPLATLVGLAVTRAAGGGDGAWALAFEQLAVATIVLTLLTILGRAFASGRANSVAVSMAMLWTSSFGWIPALIGKPLKFRRTPKIAERATKTMSVETLASITAIVAAIFFAKSGSWFAALVLAVSASGLITGWTVDRKLQRAAAAG